MRSASFLLLSAALSGCYAFHGFEADAGSTREADAGSTREDAGIGDAGSCFEPEAEVYLRNDCEFCNAFHYTWLRRCGSRVYVADAFGAGLRAAFRLGECGTLTIDACARPDACLPLSDCSAVDVDTLEALLDTRSDSSSRGGALPFEPHDADAPFAEPPTCESLAAMASACE